MLYHTPRYTMYIMHHVVSEPQIEIQRYIAIHRYIDTLSLSVQCIGCITTPQELGPAGVHVQHARRLRGK